MAVATCDWSAELFLHVSSAGRTSWQFLSSLEATGVPSKAAVFLRETTRTIEETLTKARRLLQRGYLSEYLAMVDAIASLHTQRAAIAKQICDPARRRPEPEQSRCAWHVEQCDEALADRVALALRDSDHALVDGFLSAAEAQCEVEALLRTMHASGTLRPGRVKGGLNAEQRSDLMVSMPGTLEQPPALRTTLSALDRLVLALLRHPALASDLRDVPLVRAEVQCTCYPGDGAKYVKHTDDAREQTRKLTCILYCNPRWAEGDGGQLRLYLPRRSRVETVAPRANRLVLFWSDARVPHEVLPAFSERYAVTVWYSDARGVRAAAAASLPRAPPGAANGDATPAVQVRRLAGRGFGVVALRPIAAGEQLFAERPLVVWQVDRRGGHAELSEISALVDALDEGARATYYSLVDAHGPGLTISAAGKLEPPPPTDEGDEAIEVTGDGFTRSKTAAGIWASNAFHLEQGDCFTPASGADAVHAAVFPTIARLNHSCAPSCFAAWNPTRGCQTVHALRAIPAGEELTIAYVGGAAWDGRRTCRREELWRKYRFRCSCEVCILRGAALSGSEERRGRLFDARQQLLRADEHGMGTPFLATAEALWGLATAEGLPAVWQRAMVLEAMQHAKEAGDVGAAIRWAERGAQSARLALGADAPTTAKFEMVVRAWKTASAKGDPLPG